MRTRSSLRVILHRESRLSFDTNAFYRSIIQVHMCHLYMIAILDRLRIYTKTVILGGDLRTASHQVLHRMVQATVTVMHFICRDVVGPCQQLMAKADAKERPRRSVQVEGHASSLGANPDA